MNKKEVIKACEEQKLYDFIANNYYALTKDELKDILLEAIYNVADDEMISEGLEERWQDELEPDIRWCVAIRHKEDDSLVDGRYFDTREEAYNEEKNLREEYQNTDYYIVVEEVED